MTRRRSVWVSVAMLGIATAIATPAAEDVVLQAMQQELQRSMEKLQLEELDKPYFVSYEVEDHDDLTVSGTFGSLESTDRRRMRLLTVEVRVGDYALDNTNFRWFPGRPAGVLRTYGGTTTLPLDDDLLEIRRTLWLATDGAYKRALQQLSMKRAALQNTTLSEELPDFSREEPVQITDTRPDAAIDASSAESMVRELSGVFRELSVVHDSRVWLTIGNSLTRYVNSEGSRFVRNSPSVQLSIVALSQADDGQPIDDHIVALGRGMEDLPPAEQLVGRIRAMGQRISSLRRAPVAERYNGPVFFEGPAAAELFAQGFAPHLLASREPVASDPRYGMANPQTGVAFEDRIGARVLPRFLKLVDDPTMDDYDGQVLVGSYTVDDQGVPARRTTVIERGILKTLLADRTPVSGVEHSTGNSRGGGVLPGNLVLTTAEGMSADELRRELLLEIADRELEYGILVRRVGHPWLVQLANRSRGIRGMPGMPGEGVPLIEAYRVYPDGREELIRNAEAIGLNPRTFKDIIAASSDPKVHSSLFMSRSSSGRFARGPISLIVPSLLFEDLTLNKPGGQIPNPPVADHPYFQK
jgi:predicted Zn-dependent protease